MNKSWAYLIVAGISEIVWAYGLKMTHGFSVPGWSIFTLIVLFISFYLFAHAAKTIPMGTAYAIFTGIGAAGTAIIGMAFLDEGVSALKIGSFTFLILGIVGLKLFNEQVDTDKK